MTRFLICELGRDGMIGLSPVAFSPETAARRDEEAFLELAREVARVAIRIEQKRTQLVLPLGGSDETVL